MISGSHNCSQLAPEIEIRVHSGYLVARNLVNRNLRLKLMSIIGFLVARNLVNGNLRSKLGLIMGFLVARNLVNGKLRSKRGH